MFMFTTNHAVILSVTMAPRRSGPHSGMIQGEECQLKHWKATGLLLRLISVQPTKVMLGRQCFCLSATFCDFTIYAISLLVVMVYNIREAILTGRHHICF